MTRAQAIASLAGRRDRCCREVDLRTLAVGFDAKGADRAERGRQDAARRIDRDRARRRETASIRDEKPHRPVAMGGEGLRSAEIGLRTRGRHEKSVRALARRRNRAAAHRQRSARIGLCAKRVRSHSRNHNAVQARVRRPISAVLDIVVRISDTRVTLVNGLALVYPRKAISFDRLATAPRR